jgi:hypothetical protein
VTNIRETPTGNTVVWFNTVRLELLKRGATIWIPLSNFAFVVLWITVCRCVAGWFGAVEEMASAGEPRSFGRFPPLVAATARLPIQRLRFRLLA